MVCARFFSALLLAIGMFVSLPYVLSAQVNMEALSAAEKELRAVFNHLQNLESIDASFSLEIFDAHNKSVAKQLGRVILKGRKYELSIGDQHIYFDGTTLWNYNKLFNEVQINDYTKDGDDIFNIEDLLSGELQYRQFTSKLNDQKTINNKKCNEIEMTPQDKTKPFFKVLLWVDPSSNNVEKAQIFSKTGTKYVYTTEKLKKNVTLAANFGMFNIKDYSGVDVVDFR